MSIENAYIAPILLGTATGTSTYVGNTGLMDILFATLLVLVIGLLMQDESRSRFSKKTGRYFVNITSVGFVAFAFHLSVVFFVTVLIPLSIQLRKIEWSGLLVV